MKGGERLPAPFFIFLPISLGFSSSKLAPGQRSACQLSMGASPGGKGRSGLRSLVSAPLEGSGLAGALPMTYEGGGR